MANRLHKNSKGDEFYEAMPISVVPTSSSSGIGTHDWQDRLISAGKSGAEGARALGRDIRSVAGSLLRAGIGRTARRIYLALFLVGTIAVGAAMFSIASSTYAIYSGDLANPATLLNKKNTGTTILDRNGKVLYQAYGAANKTPVEIEAVPKTLINATLAAEDPDFYNHPGISFKGTLRAALKDISKGSAVEGGSTLTQQFVKTALLTPDRSFIRKAQEVTLALEVEQRYTKDEILEMYFNSVYYGQGSHGVGTAAKTYFHKDVKDLTLSESAMLAGLPLGPSRFDPAVYKESAIARRDYVLDRMKQLDYITEEQYTTAKAEPLVADAQQIKIEAPHFVFYVLEQLREKYGEDQIENGGITVTTSLDLDKQKAAEDIVRQRLAALKGHNASNAGLVSVDTKTGDIISMVGSVDYYNQAFGKVNVTTASLQPGSSFKPLVYLAAFKKGWNGGTKIEDKPIREPNGDGTFYEPKNFDEKYRGSMTIRRALANSLNTPTIQAVKFVGVSEVIQTARNAGLNISTDESRFGLSVGLGVIEVKPLEMATAYATIANSGSKITPRAILKVTDRDNRDITREEKVAPQTIFDPRHAYMMTSILSDNATRTESFGPNSPLKLSRPAAAKTGTTEKFRDDWTVGYTPDLATAVWVGNNDHSPLLNLTGVQGAAPIWHDFMEMAHRGLPVRDFARPEGIATAKVCLLDGGLANPWDTKVVEEVYIAGQTPTKKCGSASPKAPEPPKEEKPTEPPKENKKDTQAQTPATPPSNSDKQSKPDQTDPDKIDSD